MGSTMASFLSCLVLCLNRSINLNDFVLKTYYNDINTDTMEIINIYEVAESFTWKFENSFSLLKSLTRNYQNLDLKQYEGN